MSVTIDDAALTELEEEMAALASSLRWVKRAQADGDPAKEASAWRLVESHRATIGALLAAEGGEVSEPSVPPSRTARKADGSLTIQPDDDGVLSERPTSGAGGRSLNITDERSPR